MSITSYFPFGPTMISLAVDLADGRTIEVASIGQEGAVGGIVSCGHAPAFARAEVMVAGPALRVPMDDARGSQGAARPTSATCSAAFPIICSPR